MRFNKHINAVIPQADNIKMKKKVMQYDKKILLRLYLLFIPIAYFSYLFHEFGHWIIGKR